MTQMMHSGVNSNGQKITKEHRAQPTKKGKVRYL